VTTQRNVYLLMLAQAFFLACSMTLVTFAGLSGKLLANDPAYATVAMSLAVLATALSTAPMSMLMQRTSRRFGFRLGALFGVIGGLTCAGSLYIGSFYMLCVGTLLMGPFQASAQYFRFAAAESVDTARAPRAISLVLIGGLIAALFAPMIVSTFNDIFDARTYLGAFLFVAVAAALMFLPLGFLKHIDGATSAEDVADTAAVRPLGVIVRSPTFIVAVLNAALGYAMMTFVMTATPLAVEACGIGVDTGAGIIQKHVIAMFLPSLFTGHLIARFGLVPILLTGHLLFAVAFVTALSGIQVWQFSVALIALGVGWNFCFIGGTSLLTQAHTDAEKGKVQGLNEFLVFGSAASASFAAGIILAKFGWTTVNQAAFAMLVIATGATLFWALFKKQAQAAE
jgi:MFS family permease